MKLDEIVSKVDTLCPNQYDKETKLTWLSELESRIRVEVLDTHYPIKGPEPYNPYEEDMYVYYLQGMIAFQNSEIPKYNQFMALYNAAYTDYVNAYNRTHMPKQGRRGNRFHF